MQLETALAQFETALIADGMKRSTVRWYKSLLLRFAEAHPNAALKSIDTNMIRLYLTALRTASTHWNGSQRVAQDGGLSDDTINAHTRALHKFWSWCALEYEMSNPMSRIRYPKKPDTKPKAITIESVKALFHATATSRAGARDRAILAFLLDTGCRAGGLVTLKMIDLELEQNKATVIEKGSRTRTIYFTDLTKEALVAWLTERQQGATHVFYNLETLQPLTVYGLRQLLKRLAKRAGVEGRVNPHSFRHSFAREYLRAGGDLSTLSRLMGHRDVTTTVRHYAIFSNDEVRAAHEKYSPAQHLSEEIKNAPSGDDAL